MRLLFELDKHDYIPGGTVGRRPSVRGIIVQNGLLLMVHSLRDDYYKFPGGGIDGSETHTETLCREVREETGMTVRPETVRTYGLVRRIQKGVREDIFLQENFYYFCEISGETGAQSLDRYEAEEQFTPEWVTPAHAIAVNEAALAASRKDGFEAAMVEREIRVLGILTAEFPALFARSKL